MSFFDLLQVEGKSFVIRIKAGRNKRPIKEHEVNPDCIVFYDAEVLLGIVENNLVGYRVNGVDYWIAMDCRNLTAEQIAQIYKLRWSIKFFNMA